MPTHPQIGLNSSPLSRREVKFERRLLVLFLLSLPLLNPWVRGDGVGYYAFARAPLIEHNFDFLHDYQSANDSFREARLDANGLPKAEFRTRTGHLDNHFTVGPAILWTPFLVVAHLGVVLARMLGSHVVADGFSAPYRFAFAFGTALYGFLGLLLAMRLARVYVGARWAFVSTISIWWASSLPVYMYFNPSWSHAHSAFTVSLFLWYWNRTREPGIYDQGISLQRTRKQWCVLALIAGLMLNVYYVNVLLLVVLVFDAFTECSAPLRNRNAASQLATASHAETVSQAAVLSRSTSQRINGPPAVTVPQLLGNYFLFAAIVAVCLAPTFITRYIVYGNPFESGYGSIKNWAWKSPFLLQVLFSSNHGLFVWTPITVLAMAGLFLLWRQEPRAGGAMLAAAVAFYLFIACYPDWAGISSYGNRFFVSLTSLFIVGLGALLQRGESWIGNPRVMRIAMPAILACFILWNAAFMFQWGTHLVPVRGEIVWSEMIRNQFLVVPRELSTKLRSYLFHRSTLMKQIEHRDLEQLQR